jgi:cytochrome b561
MTTEQPQFNASMRFLHWLMAAMVLIMLGIGISMVASDR